MPVTDLTGLFVAQDVSLFTRATALKPPADDRARLASFPAIFDLDECKFENVFSLCACFHFILHITQRRRIVHAA